jgi:hypothetical protein
MDFRTIDLVDNYDANNISYAYYAFVWTPLFYGLTTVGGYFIYKKSPLTSGIFQILMGAIAFPIMSRTTGSVFTISGLLVLVTVLVPNLKRIFIYQGQLKQKSLQHALLGFLGMFIGVYYTYAFLAENGTLGERQYNKFISQTSSSFGNTPWGVIMTGRHYTLGAILRISDNPIFGAGSWPRQEDTMFRACQILGKGLRERDMNPNKRELGHSVLFGMWAQSGPLVLPFFFIIIVRTFRFTIRLLFSNLPHLALLLPYLILFLFSIFFNNFNSVVRMQMITFPIMCHFYTQKSTLKTKQHTNNLVAKYS